MKRKFLSILLALLVVVTALTSCETILPLLGIEQTETEGNYDLSNVPAFADKAYVSINNNQPFFTESEITDKSFEKYAELDRLGRCGVAVASVGKDLMPTEDRGSIGSVKPSGWHTVKYDCVDGRYLYNRCHLIGYQLTAENANKQNLITGTRYLNIEGMLPFENMVADYVKETNNHVMYRVTPIFEGNDLVAKGVLMEGLSVEDKGDGICFCIYAYNSQPGIDIDYKTGESCLSGEKIETAETGNESTNEVRYVINSKTKKFHREDCASVKNMNEADKEYFTGSRETLIEKGYTPCKNCNP